MKRILFFTIFFLIYGSGLIAQKAFSGRLVDQANKEPLIGGTIQLKGSNSIFAISAQDGTFSISVPNDQEAIFLCSYTGYRTREVLLSEETQNLQIELVPLSTLLDEVVVIGFGVQTRSDITGNISKVRKEDIENNPVTSLESTLQGRAAGVFVSNGSGKLGQPIDVQIRGIASLNASNDPLYVVDGVVINSKDQLSYGAPRINPMGDINFRDIESIEILKDASASAIYGSRASNGVILITTKSGGDYNTRIELDLSVGISRPTRKREWLNAAQYLELWDEAFVNVANEQGRVFGQTGEQWKDSFLSGWRDGYDTNWEDLIYNDDAGLRQAQLNISGGNERTNFYFSGGYTDQTAIIILNAYERLNGRFNLAHQISPKLDIGMNMSLTRSNNQEVPSDFDFASPSQMVALSPLQPLYDPDGSGEIFEGTPYFHAYSYIGNTDWSTISFRTLGNAFVDWKPIKNLTIHSDFGLDLLDRESERYFNSKVVRNTGAPNGQKISASTLAFNYSTNTFATYQLQKNQHKSSLTLGMSYQELSEELLLLIGRNFPNDDFQNLTSAGEISVWEENETGFSVLSYFGRLQHNYADKYLISLSSRIDGDSRFGKNQRYGFFPAASLGWVITKEPFLADKRFLHYLKVRGSWGLTGNTPQENFPALGLYEGSRYGGLPGIVQTQIPNPDLKWEKTEQINLGVDFGLLEDRISGQIDYYIKNTNDLLLLVNIPATTGFTSQLQNVGAMRNEGVELLLNSNNLTGAFKWKTTLNFSKNRNSVTDIQGQVITAGSAGLNITRAIEGYPVGVFFTPEFAGVDPDNGDALYYLNTLEENGQINRETTNNINRAQRVVVGSPHPDFIYGINNTFSWKGLELQVFFQGVSGNDIFNAAGRFQMDGFGWFDNQNIRMLDRWQQPGDQTDIPQLRFLEGTFHSSRFVENGSYLRLKSLNFSYQLPRNWVDQIGLRQLKVYFTGWNLLTFTKYPGWDPEVNSDISNFLENGNLMLGIDHYSPPQAKSFVFGIHAGF